MFHLQKDRYYRDSVFFSRFNCENKVTKINKYQPNKSSINNKEKKEKKERYKKS